MHLFYFDKIINGDLNLSFFIIIGVVFKSYSLSLMIESKYLNF